MNIPTKAFKASSIRRCIKTLSNAGFIKPDQITLMSGIAYISIQVPDELISPKKKVKIKK